MKKIITFEIDSDQADEQTALLINATTFFHPVPGSLQIMDAPRVDTLGNYHAVHVTSDDFPIVVVDREGISFDGENEDAATARQFAAALLVAAGLCEKEMGK
jgi:hypothetical protein